MRFVPSGDFKVHYLLCRVIAQDCLTFIIYYNYNIAFVL